MIRQITIIGTGLIGGSLGLALRKNGFKGKRIGCDRPEVLRRAKRRRAIDQGITDPLKAIAGSDVVVLATPVGGIVELISRLGPGLSNRVLLTDVGSTKSAILSLAQRVFGARTSQNFLGSHPMAGKENSGIESADAELFRGAVWFLTPAADQILRKGIVKDYVLWLKRIGAKIAVLGADEHDQLCAWISHVPQMISTALAASLIDEYGEQAQLLESGGRALREMTRIAASPYSMWRDIALTNKKSIAEALLKLEQRLAHLRENLDTRELEAEFDHAHKLRSSALSSRRKPARHR
ncbi:MAG TPA: prephenate dehydrogenase/arogenate dehydrogenase family protein [Terriglobales bacterium]|nr:prephenate dehydrogenase/arogenate dehydrogenase family protein [Terriglobales bacterium]